MINYLTFLSIIIYINIKFIGWSSNSFEDERDVMLS